GTPSAARRLVERAAAEIGVGAIAVHFHDTYGQALANAFACLEVGVAVVDASVAGLGGCPYAPGAGGNLATEDAVYMLRGMGIETGVDLDALRAVGRGVSAALGRASSSRAAIAMDRRAAPR
ncbi:MAG: hydroxymethylglutaryl-CoA lyase, partial [Hyphomicrobiales bacterium]|nr:hydroxymethylglutaryl-CoA lyase [Hyphomicrobiales bacterium]